MRKPQPGFLKAPLVPNIAENYAMMNECGKISDNPVTTASQIVNF